jgi:hypothetical protein
MDALHWVGTFARDTQGGGLGKVAGVFVDRETGAPLWLVLGGGQGRYRCVPLNGVIARAGRIVVPWTKRLVERGPIVPVDGGLSARIERELCDLFGITATRGARLSRWERRRSASIAWIDPSAPEGYAWRPPRRGADAAPRVPTRQPEERRAGPADLHLPEALRGRVTPPPRRH